MHPRSLPQYLQTALNSHGYSTHQQEHSVNHTIQCSLVRSVTGNRTVTFLYRYGAVLQTYIISHVVAVIKLVSCSAQRG
jgi:hypothetical protein